MTTEFATHQRLNDKKYHTVNTYNHEVKDNSPNESMNNISMKIDLRNNMSEISVEDKYEFNYRSLFLLPFTISMVLLNNTGTEIVVKVVYNSLIFLLCLVIIIWGLINKKKVEKQTLKQFVNQKLGFERSTDPNDVFDFEQRQYAGLVLLVCIMCSSGMEVFDQLMGLILWMHTTVITSLLPLILNLTFVILHKTVKCNERIEEEKKSIFEKYKNTNNIQQQIEQRLEDWKKSKKLTDKFFQWPWDMKLCNEYDRRIELCCIFVIVFLVHYIGTGFLDWDIFNNHPNEAFILVTVYFVYDCVFITFVIYFFNTIYLHYKFPAIIMDELSVSINSETTDDLIGWWQLRKFYAHSIVKIYTSSLGLIVGLLTLGCIVLALSLIKSIIDHNDNLLDMEIIELGIFTTYFVSITFLFVSNATNYHSNQLSHINMIHRELMALRKYKEDEVDSIKNNDELELKKYENDIQHYVASQMIQDVKNNSHIIKVMGISIDAKFMVMLRAGLGTLFIAVISLIFAK